MKKSSLSAHATKSTHCCGMLVLRLERRDLGQTNLVGVVKVHDAAPARGDVLVALALAAHDQGRVHVHVVAGEVQADQALEDHRVCGFGGGEEDEQAGSGAAVCNHVQDRAETGRLVEFARSKAVKRIEEAADRVEEAAAARVKRHEVQRAEG